VSEALPRLYARWFDEALGGEIPHETKATCRECAMCARADEPPGKSVRYFNPQTKCCTYVPELANFLVGGILADARDDAAPGRVAMEARLQARVAVTPLGIGRSPQYALLYAEIGEAFGRSLGLVCPYYVQPEGLCGVWRHRNAICSTWFCKHVRGATGKTFWRDGVQPLLEVVEADLGIWCALELGCRGDHLRALTNSGAWSGRQEALTAEALEDRIEDDAYAELWGSWSGREKEYYLRCAEIVDRLSWSDVLEIAGPKARAYVDVMRGAYEKLISEHTPARLEAGVLQVERMGPEAVRVGGYSPNDPIDIPHVIMALLPMFEGRRTQDALALIESETGIRLEPALVLKLVDFGVLVALP
jgi:hypothetical protein